MGNFRKRYARRRIAMLLADAVRLLYHNATLSYPSYEGAALSEEFSSWLEREVPGEIEYLNTWCGYGSATTSYVPPKYSTPAAQRMYLRWKRRLRAEEEWEIPYLRIRDFGELYQYGRGGRTLAPEDLVRTYGGSSFSCKLDPDRSMTYADAVCAYRVIKSFNQYVRNWCDSVPDQFAAWVEEQVAEARHYQLTMEVFDGIGSRKARPAKAKACSRRARKPRSGAPVAVPVEVPARPQGR